MRKVFLSTMLLSPMQPTNYISDNFDLKGKQYLFPLTYLIDRDVKVNDDVLVITVIQEGGDTRNYSINNNEQYKQEIRTALYGRNANVKFLDIEAKKDINSSVFDRFFKDIAFALEDGDDLYMDVTFGQKPFSFSMFIAGIYATKACRNTNIQKLIYCQKYLGDITDKNPPSKIYDITELFNITELACSLPQGTKKNTDRMLNLILGE